MLLLVLVIVLNGARLGICLNACTGARVGAQWQYPTWF